VARGVRRRRLEVDVIPIGAIVGAAMAARGGNARTDPTAANIGVRVLASFLLLPVFFLLREGMPVHGAVFGAVVVPLLFPSIVLRRVLVPLGMHRTAYVFARISPPVAVSEEIPAGAVFYAALALHRARVVDPARLDALDARLARQVKLRGVALAACGLLAALRGQRENARLLLGAVDGIHWRFAPRIARSSARAWLVADAAARGDWRRVVALGRGRGSYMRWPYAMASIAARLLGDADAPSPLALRLLWLLAPQRRATLPLLLRALAMPAPASPPLAADSLEAALRAHATFLRTPTSATVAGAARAWDLVREAPEVRALVIKRAAALEAPSATGPDGLVSGLVDRAAGELAPYADRAPPRVAATSPTMQRACAEARRRDLDALDDAAGDVRKRADWEKSMHVFAEWSAWTSLRVRGERLRRTHGDETRRVVFDALFNAGCNYAVWLFNVRGERLLAHGIFRWLHDEGKAVGARAETIGLLKKNMGAGHGG
jgi:hypothetical protein